MEAKPSFAIDQKFVSRRIEELAQIGVHPDGGMNRLVYTESWRRAMSLVSEWLESDGFDVKRDAVGNLYGVVQGQAPGNSIVTGSHIDTVRQGGKLDGALGVVAAYSAVRALTSAYGQPRRTLEVLVTCEEEGSRFHSNFWGSRAITGLIQADEAAAIFDEEGTSLADAMRTCGLDPLAVPTARRDDIDTFIELHIEQGPSLEQEGVPIGIVTGITGLTQIEYRIQGRADHAGACPMDLRLDPMVAAAEIVLAVNRTAKALGHPAVATVGRISAYPGAPNIVPAEVRLTVDLRHPDAVEHRRLAAQIREACEAVAARHGVELSSHQLIFQPPVQCSPDIVGIVRQAALNLGFKFLEMASGAGHDTQVLAGAGIRTAMIFVPSHNGRSHSPEEYTSPEDIVRGITVLAQALYLLAY